MRTDPRYEKDPRSSEEVARAYRASLEDDDANVSLAVVHYRGGQHEFNMGCVYARSTDPLDRVVGADVLAQLGWGDDSYQDESVTILLALLDDEDPRVVSSAAHALGHRNDARAIPELLKRVTHPEPSVRLGVVHGLSMHDDVSAVRGLIELAADTDRDVRNWAAFGLGSQADVDVPELREALVALLEDPDLDIRGEALIGLARRHDPRVKAALIRELQGEFHGSWCLEAAEELAELDLANLLCTLRGRVFQEDLERFKQDFDKVIRACETSVGDGSTG
jgi:HEAT repeat protein